MSAHNLGRTVQNMVPDGENHHSSLEPQAKTTTSQRSSNLGERNIYQAKRRKVNQGGSVYEGGKYSLAGNSTYVQGNVSIYSEGSVPKSHGCRDQREIRSHLSKSLSFPEIENRRSELENDSETIREETCQWFFKTEKFNAWMAPPVPAGEGAKPVLVIKGKPGSGKSILLIRAFRKCNSSRESITIGFFNNLKGTALEHTKKGLYSSLLSQLLTLLPDDRHVLEIAENLLRPDANDWPNIDNVKRALRELLQVGCIRDRRIFLFLDALDECQNNEHAGTPETEDVFEFLEGLLEKSANMRVCLSLRDGTKLERSSMTKSMIDVTNHNDSSIRIYLEHQLKATISRFRPQFREELLTSLTNRSSNMFLWARLVVDRIKNSGPLNERKILTEVQKAPSELTGLFANLVQRTNLESCGQTLAILQLVHVAVKPLTLADVQSAVVCIKMSDESDDPPSDSSEAFTPEDFGNSSLTAGLVEISRSVATSGRSATAATSRSQVVQFIHSSVREFVSEGGLTSLGPGLDSDPESQSHLLVAKMCMRMLSTPEAKDLAAGSQTPAKDVPFLQYASQFWTLHVRKAHEIVNMDLEDFSILSQCSERTDIILKLFREQQGSRFYAEKKDIPSPSRLTCLLCPNPSAAAQECQESMFVLLAFEGCTGLVGHHAKRCKRGQKCHANSHILHRAFFSAAHRGWEATAQAVLNVAAMNKVSISVNMRLGNGFTPLHTACFKGEGTVAGILLKMGADPLEKAQGYYELPLHAAVSQDNKEVVELLLRSSKPVKRLLAQKDSTEWTVLHQAAKSGSFLTLKDILRHMESHDLAKLVHEKNEQGKTACEIAEIEASCHHREEYRRKMFRKIADTLSEFASAN